VAERTLTIHVRIEAEDEWDLPRPDETAEVVRDTFAGYPAAIKITGLRVEEVDEGDALLLWAAVRERMEQGDVGFGLLDDEEGAE
jgi:hypothetical protein